MNYRQPQLREASGSVRQAIFEALQANAYSIKSESLQYLLNNQFDPIAIVDQVKDYITQGKRLYYLYGEAVIGIKYECCLRHEGLVVLVKMANNQKKARETWWIEFIFHDHNTGYAPLPE